MKNDNLEGFLIDFDGVISKQSHIMTMNLIYDYINEIAPLPFESFKRYFKIASCFPAQEFIESYFRATGLGNKIPGLYEKYYQHMNEYKNTKVEIHEEFYKFIAFCDKNSLRYVVVSLAQPERLSKIQFVGKDAFYALDGQSKAAPATFEKIKMDLAINLQNFMMIDDTPLVLRAAKLAGCHTSISLNDLYTEEDDIEFNDFIDFKVHSFESLINICHTKFRIGSKDPRSQLF